MDLYTLDEDYLPNEVIEGFESLIWTERYSGYGEFVLVTPLTEFFRTVLVEDTFLSIPASIEAMYIDTVSIDNDAKTIQVQGKAMPAALANRMVRDSYKDEESSWTLTGSPGQIANKIVREMVAPGGLMDGNGILPHGEREIFRDLVMGAAAGGTSVTIAVPYGVLYDAIKTICDSDQIGFDMYPVNMVPGDHDITFTTYRGLDRTSSQSTNPVVIFEPSMDSLASIKELRSTAAFKNVAIVFPTNIAHQSDLQTAISSTGDDLLTGFARRTLMVTADDIDVAEFEGDIVSALSQKGKDALAAALYVRTTDGTIVPQNAFKYLTDYNLGDIIELRGPSNFPSKARVTEYIRAQDASGETAYPTLSVIS